MEAVVLLSFCENQQHQWSVFIRLSAPDRWLKVCVHMNILMCVSNEENGFVIVYKAQRVICVCVCVCVRVRVSKGQVGPGAVILCVSAAFHFYN